MRSQATLRLCGGLVSAMLVLCALVTLLADVPYYLFQPDLFTAMHYVADVALLGVGGTCGVFAEIRPRTAIREYAPFLMRMGGRATFYLFMGMYVIGRRPGSAQGVADKFVGVCTLVVAAVTAVMSLKVNDQPLLEPSLCEMDDMYVEAPSGGFVNDDGI